MKDVPAVRSDWRRRLQAECERFHTLLVARAARARELAGRYEAGAKARARALAVAAVLSTYITSASAPCGLAHLRTCAEEEAVMELELPDDHDVSQPHRFTTLVESGTIVGVEVQNQPFLRHLQARIIGGRIVAEADRHPRAPECRTIPAFEVPKRLPVQRVEDLDGTHRHSLHLHAGTRFEWLMLFWRFRNSFHRSGECRHLRDLQRSLARHQPTDRREGSLIGEQVHDPLANQMLVRLELSVGSTVSGGVTLRRGSGSAARDRAPPPCTPPPSGARNQHLLKVSD